MILEGVLLLRPILLNCPRLKRSSDLMGARVGALSCFSSRGPKLGCGPGDDPGRAAGRSVRRDLAGALPQVHLGVLASGLHALFGGTSPTPTFLSASSSGRSEVRSRRPQPPPSPPGLTVAPTHSSRPPRPARDRRAGPADRLRGPPTPTRGSPAAGDPTCRRARAGPPRARRAARATSRRFTPREPLLPCLAAHPGA